MYQNYTTFGSTVLNPKPTHMMTALKSVPTAHHNGFQGAFQYNLGS